MLNTAWFSSHRFNGSDQQFICGNQFLCDSKRDGERDTLRRSLIRNGKSHLIERGIVQWKGNQGASQMVSLEMNERTNDASPFNE